MKRTIGLVSVLAVIAAAACSDRGVGTSPKLAAAQSGANGHGETSSSDSASRASQQMGIYLQVVGPLTPSDTESTDGPVTLIADARVTLRASGSSQTVGTGLTDTAGLFNFASVADGTYSVQATPPAGSGYGAAEADNIVVRNGQMTTAIKLVIIRLPKAG